MIIFMGVAGSGKSIQGRLLADQLGLPWLSTGEFLRMLVAGERRKEMVAGKLLDDQDIIALLQKIFAIINASEHEFVLDGFPRTAKQADWLLSQVKHGQLDITAVIHLQATEQVVLDRLLKRGRQDDAQEAIMERFREYEDAIKPILTEFKEANIPVCEIEAEGDVQAINAKILETLKIDLATYANQG